MLTKFIQLHDPKQPHVSRVQTNVDAVLRPVAEAVAVTPMGGAKPPPWILATLPAAFAQATGVQSTQFHKDALGYVWLSIGVSTAAGVGARAPITTLPLGYRPSVLVIVPAVTFSAGASIALSVSPAGIVAALPSIGAGDGVVGYFSFLAEQ